jgi:hypothetical protein
MKTLFTFFLLTQITFMSFAQRELWGTVSTGGNYGHGYIFKTDSIGEQLEVMHHFDSIHGKNPSALLSFSNNKLYGTTAYGGQMAGTTIYQGGTFFSYDLTTNTYTVLQDFGPENTTISGFYPAGDGMVSLTAGANGLLYGHIRFGSPTRGHVYTYDPATGIISSAVPIPTYLGETFNTPQGNLLAGPLYQSPDGFMYATTVANSQCPITSPYRGSIIRIDPATNAYSIRYLNPCSTTDGYQYQSQYVMHNDQLYGVSKAGGAYGDYGVIYAFQPATNTYIKKHDFEGGALGKQPLPMIQSAANGKFYGVAYGGTPEPNLANGGGILYEFDPVLDTFIKKLDFLLGTGSYLEVGPYPFSLINGFNGKLYGVTPNGVFSYDLALNTTQPAARFPIDLGWGVPDSPSLTAVCRKPGFVPFSDTTITSCTGGSYTQWLHSENATSYVWKHNGTADSEQTADSLSFTDFSTADAGTWTAEMTNVCGTTISAQITIHIQTGIAAVITQNGTALQSTTAADYQWIDCAAGNAPINGANAQTFVPGINGAYAVITTTNGCPDTSTCFVLDDLGLSNPASLSHLSIYPNPVGAELQILSELTVLSAEVLSTTGQCVLKGDSAILPVAILQPGTYFLRVETVQGNWHGKFVKD